MNKLYKYWLGLNEHAVVLFVDFYRYFLDSIFLCLKLKRCHDMSGTESVETGTENIFFSCLEYERLIREGHITQLGHHGGKGRLGAQVFGRAFQWCLADMYSAFWVPLKQNIFKDNPSPCFISHFIFSMLMTNYRSNSALKTNMLPKETLLYSPYHLCFSSSTECNTHY